MCGITLRGQKEGLLRRVRVQQSEHPHCKRLLRRPHTPGHQSYKASGHELDSLASRGHYQATFQSTSCPLISLRESLDT